MTAISGNTPGQGEQLYSAALSKKQQLAEGKMALSLIDAAAAPAPTSAPPSTPTANLGNHINIKA